MKDLNISKCKDGKTYKCPKCKRIFNKKGLLSHWSKVCGNTGVRYSSKQALINIKTKKPCPYCNKNISITGLKTHIDFCIYNPKNKNYWKICPVCESKFYDRQGVKVTCSYSCSNKYFRSGTKYYNFKNSKYTTRCWAYHKRKCIVCGESNVVSVHHFDGNHFNNAIRNLVPLCPTHHSYVHSKYKYLVWDKILNYVNKFKLKYKGKKL